MLNLMCNIFNLISQICNTNPIKSSAVQNNPRLRALIESWGVQFNDSASSGKKKKRSLSMAEEQSYIEFNKANNDVIDKINHHDQNIDPNHMSSGNRNEQYGRDFDMKGAYFGKSDIVTDILKDEQIVKKRVKRSTCKYLIFISII